MTDDLIRETDRFWEKPENVLRLIDLIFFFQEEKDVIPS